MLLSKQWSRVAGGVLAVVVFFLVFNFLDTKPYQEYWRAKTSSSSPATNTNEDFNRPKLPYRPQDEGEQTTPAQSVEDKISDLTGSNEHKTPYRPQTEEQNIKQDFSQADTNGKQSGNAPANTPPLKPAVDLPYRPQDESQHGSPGHAADKAEENESQTTTSKHVAIGLPPAELSTATSTPSITASSAAIDSTSTAFRKAIVMGRTSEENADWVKENLPDWEPYIYVVDLEANATSPTGFKTQMNKAREAMPYLTFMATHYDDFPDIAVFLHAHRNGWPKAWHNDAKGYDAVNMLKQLQLPEVQRRGYTNLRCIDFPGCPNEVQLNRPGKQKLTEEKYPEVYGEFFNMTVPQVKERIPIIATPCCAQFAITRQQLHRRSKKEYERFVKIMEENSIDDHTLGTIMEYMWHLLFFQDAVYCDDTASCWKSLYGRPDGWTNDEYTISLGKSHN